MGHGPLGVNHLGSAVGVGEWGSAERAPVRVVCPRGKHAELQASPRWTQRCLASSD